jgi:threonine/homoserine/homoserine lactone efflux protein
LEIIFLLILSCLVSFLGSIPLGSLNLTALQIYIVNKKSALVFFALASALIEFVYSLAAINLEQTFNQIPEMKLYLQIGSSLVFFCLAGYNFFSKPKTINSVLENKVLSNTKSFVQGILLSLFNLQAILFWIFLSHFFRNQFNLKLSSFFESIIFAIGVAIGTFFSLYLFAVFFSRIFNNLIKPESLNKILSVLFFLLFLLSLRFHL